MTLILLQFWQMLQPIPKCHIHVLILYEMLCTYFRVHHLVDRVGGLYLHLLEVPRPDLVDPVDLPDDARRHDLRLEPRVGELEADYVEDLGPALLVAVGGVGAAPVAVLKVLVPLLHCHRRVLLRPARF